MNEVQRNATLCFWYDSEMQSGGNLQCFENTSFMGNTDYMKVIDALLWFGAKKQSEVLLRAISTRKSEKRGLIKSVVDFVKHAEECLYEDLDNEYYECEPDLNCLFEKMLEKHQEEFVLIE